MRNQESRFALNPTNLDIQRSRFDRDSSVKLTFNVGDLICFYSDEVLPGDTHQIRTSKVVRLQTMLTPMMDNLYLDTYYFFVPYRLVWDHWRQFMGENTESAWLPETEYQIPQIAMPEGGWTPGTIADYMGVPTSINSPNTNTISALPFRAYALVCNEWFRDENLQDPLVIPKGDETVTGSNGSNYIVDCALGGKPFIAAKYHDYFTSALPAPQKGPDTLIPFAAQQLPVLTSAASVNSPNWPLRWTSTASGVARDGVFNHYLVHDSSDGNDFRSYKPATAVETTITPQAAGFVAPTNLFAQMDGIGTTINQLRLAFQIQKFYERNARGGTRYIEIIKSHFNVTSPDARMMRPEYLGGNRIPINVNQVIQQSATDQISPQGNVTGQSLTTDVNGDFVHSFTEHGIILGLMVARYDHTYQQGLERFWSRKDKFDFYWPVFANIGEQPIYNKELYYTGYADRDNEVFGYQEAWADYRYKPSRVAGEMRSNVSGTLDSWHLADFYGSQPYLSADWIKEDKTNVDRVLAVTSVVSNQMFADIYIQNRATRPIPLYSVPGLIDHH